LTGNETLSLITVIVPLSRPELAEHVVDQFARQSHPDKRLWIVENGRGIGAMQRQMLWADRVLSSGQAASLARNTALDELKRSGGGYWCSWDDDDEYLPKYLSEVAACSSRAEVTGKEPHFVSYDDEHLFFFHAGRDSRFTERCQGGTLSGWAETALPFPQLRLGEDLRWCEAMRKVGARIWSRGIHHYLYRRRSAGPHQHATGRQTIEMMIYTQGRGMYLGPVDPRVISGALPLPEGRPVRPHERFMLQ